VNEWHAGAPGHVRTVRDLVERQATLHPDGPFLLAPDTGDVLTFSGLRDGARRAAAWLATLRLAAGDRVALLLDNQPALVELLIGAQYGGFVPVPLSTFAAPPHLAAAVAHSEARIVVVESEDRARALRAGPASGTVRVLSVDDRDDQRVAAGARCLVAAAIDPAADAILAYTSGTTGRPKGVRCSHTSVLAGADNVVRAHHLGPKDRALCVLPLSQRGPQNSTLMATLASGGSLVLPRRFDLARFWALVIEYECTWLPLVPTLVAELLSRPDPVVRPGALRRVRFARSSAAALGTAAQQEFETRFGLPLLQCMGSTEAGSNIFSSPLPPARRKAGSPGVSVGFEVRVVDETGQPLPAHEVGEITVRGPSVMTGYLKDAAATADVLSPDGWLRLGDLGYLDAEGYAFIVGRVQEFVNKGGVKIALPEIEEALGRHPTVLQAAAVGVPDAYLGEEIGAFVVLQAGASAAAEALLEYCERALGDFRTPAWIEIVGELPRGPAGKVERRRLAEAARRRGSLGATADLDRSGVELERAVAAAWREVGLAPDGPQDDFFMLGGDSLLALTVLARLRRRLGADIPTECLFEAPTIAGLAGRIAALAGSGDVPLLPQARGQPLRLAPVQERVWRASVQSPPSTNVVTVSVELTGSLDGGRLERMLGEIVRRHEILRTTYVMHDGEPAQLARAEWPAPLPLVDLSADPDPAGAADRITLEEAALGLALQRGSAFRALLLRLGPVRHRLVLYLHTLVGDRRSVEILFAEAAALYAETGARGLPEATLQYADYAVWQRQRLSPDRELYPRQIAYWTARLAPGPTTLSLPFRRRRPAEARPHEGFHAVRCPPDLSARIAALSRRERATPYMTWLAGLAALLHRLTGCRDLLVGTHASTRSRAELEDLMGYFLNTVHLRIAVEPALSFRALLERTRIEATQAFGHADVTFDQVAAALQATGHAVPEVRVMFQYADNPERAQLRLAGLQAIRLPPVVAAMPWGLTVTPKARGVVEAFFDPRLYEPTGVRGMLEELVALLGRATADPNLSVAELTRVPSWVWEVARTWLGSVQPTLARLVGRWAAP
jgi:acyl-CoA synthetase (AMP-forming)/AMP-acid ligase II